MKKKSISLWHNVDYLLKLARIEIVIVLLILILSIFFIKINFLISLSIWVLVISVAVAYILLFISLTKEISRIRFNLKNVKDTRIFLLFDWHWNSYT